MEMLKKISLIIISTMIAIIVGATIGLALAVADAKAGDMTGKPGNELLDATAYALTAVVNCDYEVDDAAIGIWVMLAAQEQGLSTNETSILASMMAVSIWSEVEPFGAVWCAKVKPELDKAFAVTPQA